MLRRSTCVLGLACLVLICTIARADAPARSSATAPAAEYHVGPGQKFAKVTDVPWETLNPGDTVFIHWRTDAQGGDYHEKINLTRAGTQDHPIRIVGVKGPHGERPCLNGKDALTRTVDPQGNSTFYAGNQDRGVLCFSGRNGGEFKTGPGADHWEISGLKITGARPANDYTDSFGKRRDYQRAQGGLGSAGAGVFIDRGNYLHFVDLELTDNNNGFFGSSDNAGSEARHVHDITLEYSLLYANGAPNNASVHNAYVEAANFTVRGNYFGPLVAASGGSHIKDRGANVLIENNFFDGTAVPLFLDPPEYSEGWMETQPGFDKITLRNNVLRKDGHLPVNAMDIITVGFGSYTKIATVRTVEISHNTFILSTSQRENWSFNLLDLMAKPQTIKWDGNLLLRFVEAKGAAPSGLVFVSKIDPVDEKTVIDIGPHNVISAQETFQEQKDGQGKATIKGWENLTKLPAMSREELEKKMGINLHDPTAPDFGRFDAAKSPWYRQQQAGATLNQPPTTCPSAPAVPASSTSH